MQARFQAFAILSLPNGTSILVADTSHPVPVAHSPETPPRRTDEAVRVARLQALLAELAGEIEHDRHRWAADREALRRQREAFERLVGDHRAACQLRDDLACENKELRARNLALLNREVERPSFNLPVVSAAGSSPIPAPRPPAGALPAPGGAGAPRVPDAGRGERASRLRGLISRSAHQLGEARQMLRPVRPEELVRIEDFGGARPGRGRPTRDPAKGGRRALRSPG